MAIAVAYGIAIATLLTLLILPVLLSLYSDIKLSTFWLWNGKKTEAELLEPAIIEMEAERAEIEDIKSEEK